MAFLDIIPWLEEVSRRSGVVEGLVSSTAMHHTASVFVSDDQAGLYEDDKEWLEGLVPFDASPQRQERNRIGEDNAEDP